MSSNQARHSRGWMALLMVMLPFSAAMSRWLSISPGAASFPYAYRILVAGLAVWIFIDLLSRQHQSFVTWLGMAFALSVVTWGALSVQWSLDPSSGIQKTVGLALQAIALVGVVKLIDRRPQDIALLKYGIVLAGLVECAIATWEVNTQTHLSDLIGQEWLFSYRDWPVGTFVNPNNLAAFLTFVTAVAFSLLFTDESGLMRILSAIVIAWAPIVIIDARSLGMLVSYGVIVTAYLLWMIRKHIGWLVMLILTLGTSFFVVAAGGYFDLEAFVARVVDSNQSTSFTSRLNTYIYGLQLLIDSHGLGIGPGSYEIMASGLTSRYAQDNLPLLNPHNTILELLLSYGFLVATPLILLAIIALVIYLRTFFSRKDPSIRILALEGLTGSFAVALASVIASSLMIETSWWMSIAYLIALSQVVRVRPSEQNQAASESEIVAKA